MVGPGSLPAAGGAPEGPIEPMQVATITPEGTDRYDLEVDGSALTVSAPWSNDGVDLRVALVDPTRPVSAVQHACVTWNGPLDSIAQPGLVLRYSHIGDRVYTVMVTQNIWSSARQTINVHVYDSSAPEPLSIVEHFDVSGSIGEVPNTAALPWRFCARVNAWGQVAVKVWSITDGTEPDWGDPSRTSTVDLPAGAPLVGLAGAYMGHLERGETTELSDLVTFVLTPDWARAVADGAEARAASHLRVW